MSGARFWVVVNGVLAVMVALAIFQAAQLASLRRELTKIHGGIRPSQTVCREEGEAGKGGGGQNIFFL